MGKITDLRAHRLQILKSIENITTYEEMAIRIQLAVPDINLDGKELAKMASGARSMTDKTCSEIHEAFPSYSLEWIKGNSPYPMAEDELGVEYEDKAATLMNEISDSDNIQKAICLLAAIHKWHVAFTKNGFLFTNDKGYSFLMRFIDFDEFQNDLFDFFTQKLNYYANNCKV